MSKLTYRELLEFLNKVPKERLDDMVTIYDAFEEEYFSVNGVEVANDGVLDDGHIFLSFDEVYCD